MARPKKVKLVTFAPNTNFGTCLQSYALNHILKQMGHDVEFIYNGRETPPVSLFKRAMLFVASMLPSSLKKATFAKLLASEKLSANSEEPVILTLPNNLLFGFLFKIPLFRKFYHKLKYRGLKRSKIFKYTFLDGNYNMRRLCSKGDYGKVTEEADVFITASDQIWNPFCGGYNPMMFLEFAGDAKRVAYSSSIARAKFPASVEERAKNALSKFKHIAIRETSSVAYLNKLLGRDDVKLVVDPTYLLSKEEWTEFSNRAELEFKLPERYILCYFVGDRFEDYSKMVKTVKEKTGIEHVITINCYINRSFSEQGFVYDDGGAYEFVYLLRNASLICMDSFHATIFALKFGVDFVHILKHADDSNTQSQNTRMHDIFKRYNIAYKLFDENSEAWLKPIDFERVNNLMQAEIDNSIQFLSMELAD